MVLFNWVKYKIAMILKISICYCIVATRRTNYTAYNLMKFSCTEYLGGAYLSNNIEIRDSAKSALETKDGRYSR